MDELTVGKQLLNQLTADKDILYVICPFNLGDLLINGGLCHALLKKKHKKTCVLIARDRFANCGLDFVGVKEIHYLPKILMDLIRNYIYATREYEADNYVYGHFQMKSNFEDWKSGLIWNNKLSFVDRFKENSFGLPLDTELLPPIIPPLTDNQRQSLNETYTLDKRRTIILAPYANATANLEKGFWEQLIARLIEKNKDYVIYTNTATPREKVISGTAPIVTTFPELTYIAEQVNCFIGLRSGIFDFLAFTNARLLYINHGNLYDLNWNYNHTNSIAFSKAEATNNMDSSIEQIISAVD